MKKKIFIGMATLFFTAFAFYNIQVNQQDGDISLDNVALMAQAADETPQLPTGYVWAEYSSRETQSKFYYTNGKWCYTERSKTTCVGSGKSACKPDKDWSNWSTSCDG